MFDLYRRQHLYVVCDPDLQWRGYSLLISLTKKENRYLGKSRRGSGVFLRSQHLGKSGTP